jgi:hypothetical protein
LRPSGVLLVCLLLYFSFFLKKFHLKLINLFDIVQGLMLGFNTQLVRPYFPISLMKGASREGMRRNAWGSAVPLYWCARPLPIISQWMNFGLFMNIYWMSFLFTFKQNNLSFSLNVILPIVLSFSLIVIRKI